MEINGREWGDYYFIIRASHQGVSAMPLPAYDVGDDDEDYGDNAEDGEDENTGQVKFMKKEWKEEKDLTQQEIKKKLENKLKIF